MTKLVRHSSVSQNHKIELDLPELEPGTAVEVTIVANVAGAQPVARSVTSFLGAAKGTYQSSEEADAFLSTERDRWD